MNYDVRLMNLEQAVNKHAERIATVETKINLLGIGILACFSASISIICILLLK
jgi:hypothetical protein